MISCLWRTRCSLGAPWSTLRSAGLKPCSLYADVQRPEWVSSCCARHPERTCTGRPRTSIADGMVRRFCGRIAGVPSAYLLNRGLLRDRQAQVPDAIDPFERAVAVMRGCHMESGALEACSPVTSRVASQSSRAAASAIEVAGATSNKLGSAAEFLDMNRAKVGRLSETTSNSPGSG